MGAAIAPMRGPNVPYVMSYVIKVHLFVGNAALSHNNTWNKNPSCVWPRKVFK